MSLNNNLPCTKSVPLSLNSCFTFPVSIATHCILVLLYCVNAVAVRFALLVVASISSVPSCMKPLSITLCSVAAIPSTKKISISASTATQLNSTSVPLRTVILLG